MNEWLEKQMKNKERKCMYEERVKKREVIREVEVAGEVEDNNERKELWVYSREKGEELKEGEEEEE